jgi:hypothetical protein
MISRTPFYNRHPGNLWLGMAMLIGILVAIAGATTPWLLLLPLLIWAYQTARRSAMRTTRLQQFGYFSGSRHNTSWIYEERHGNMDVALLLPLSHTEPGHWELYIPKDDVWRKLVPGWAADRRLEIASRIAEGWKAGEVHIPTDSANA